MLTRSGSCANERESFWYADYNTDVTSSPLRGGTNMKQRITDVDADEPIAALDTRTEK